MRKTVQRRRRIAGFSLLETMVAMALGGVIVAAAASSVTLINSHIYYVVKSAGIDDDVKHIEEYISSQVQEAGGGILKAGQAVRVYQGSNGPDALVVAQRHETFENETLITKFNGGNGNKKVYFEVKDFNGDGQDTCWLAGMSVNNELMVIPASGRSVSIVITKLKAKTNPNWCWVKHKWSDLDDGPAPTDLDTLFAIGGTVVAVKRVRFDVDTTNDLLKVHWLENGVKKSQNVTDRVRDFQVALGYDSVADGQISNTHDEDDEWIGNHSSDDMTTIGATDEDLRLVTVGVILAEGQNGKNESRQLLDGPTINPGDSIVRHGRTTVGVRNTNTFE